MPEYEFKCVSCGKQFTIKATIDEKEAGLACPHCGSKDIHQIFSGITFFGPSCGVDSPFSPG